MTRSGETPKVGQAPPLDFSLATMKQMAAKRRSDIWARSENLKYEFDRLKDKIDWEQLRDASSEADVNSVLAALDEFDRGRLPYAAAILATVQDDAYPKLRPIHFLAESCALSLYAAPKSVEEY